MEALTSRLVFLGLLFFTHLIFTEKNSAGTLTAGPRRIFASLHLEESEAGTLVRPLSGENNTLKIFFPGHAQELGYAAAVPQEREKDWAAYLLSPQGNYRLAAPIERSGSPVMILGDSQKSLSDRELRGLLKKTKALHFEVLSHSGGYEGLRHSLQSWSTKTLRSLSKIWLLDNFYDAGLAEILRAKVGVMRLQEICGGFATPHNEERYRGYFAAFCRVDHFGAGAHKSAVKAYF